MGKAFVYLGALRGTRFEKQICSRIFASQNFSIRSQFPLLHLRVLLPAFEIGIHGVGQYNNSRQMKHHATKIAPLKWSLTADL
jgi:hypothetical protein